jgi:alpha-L-fucosidase
MLVDAVSKGGNLLLNVGPTARGRFPPVARQTLAEIGEWMQLHGRAIYGASPSPYRPPPNCCYTQQGNRLYLHLLSWPSRFVHLEGLGTIVDYAQMLHDGSEVRVSVGGARDGFGSPLETESDTVSLTLPIRRPNVAIPVVELFLREGVA